MPKFLSTNEGIGSVGPTSSASDVLDILADGADDGDTDNSSDTNDTDSNDDGKGKGTKGKKETDKGDSDDSDADTDEIELSDEEPAEDAEEQIEAPPKKKQLLKDYPDIFKKHPYLEKMIYRDRQYVEMFGSFDDAKEANEKSQLLDQFEESLLKGNSETLLARIKESDAKAFKKVAQNLLPTLQKVDQVAYTEVVGDLVKRLVVSMATQGKKLNHEQLQDAAVLVNQFVFGTSEFEPPKQNDAPEKDEELETERAKFQQERLETAVNEMSTRITNTIKNTVAQYIDPKNEMTGYEKRHAIDDAVRIVDEAIASDRAFRKQLDRLWDASVKDKFSRATQDKIRSVILGKAKHDILPAAIKKARAEALKDKTRRTSDNNSDQEKDRRGPVKTGSSTPSRSGKPQMKPGESIADFLARD